MIRVEKRPRRLYVPGAEPVILEVWPGGLVRVRERGRRTWFSTTAGAILWAAAKRTAEFERQKREQERRARRATRRAR